MTVAFVTIGLVILAVIVGKWMRDPINDDCMMDETTYGPYDDSLPINKNYKDDDEDIDWDKVRS